MVERHYRGEADKDVFYRIPKMLFLNPRYQPISIGAKALYGLLLDRMGLSKTHERYMDEDGSVFIYFQQKDAMQLLNVKGQAKITKLYKELEKAELIERVKQGFGKPDKIYVGKVEIYPNPDTQDIQDTPENQSFDFQSSGKKEPSRPLKIEGKTFENQSSDIRFSKVYHNDTELVISERVTSINPAQAEHTNGKANQGQEIAKKGTVTGAGANNQTAHQNKDAGDGRLIITAEAPSDPYKDIFRRQLLAENLEKEFGWQETDELINALAEECAATSKTMRVNGKSIPRHWFKKEVMTMEPEHARRILYALRQIDPAKIHNRRAYLTTMCYNHKTTNWTPDEYDPGDTVPHYTKEELANIRKANMRKQEIDAAKETTV